MKTFLTAVLMAVAPGVLLAQTAAPVAPAKKATKVSAPKAPAKDSPAAIRRSALKVVEEVTPIDEDPNVQLTDSDLEIAKKVYVGLIPCELGASVNITASVTRPGFFVVQTKGARFSMHPVEARTGAVRLEDPRRGAIWIQLGNKSMLMSQKLGQRLADECMSPAQMTMADELKRNPVPGLLDAPVKPAVTVSSATATATATPTATATAVTPSAATPSDVPAAPAK